jgi:hypothetical protein
MGDKFKSNGQGVKIAVTFGPAVCHIAICAWDLQALSCALDEKSHSIMGEIMLS